MAIYDNNGTTDCEIGKIYDNNGTTDYQIGKVYDNNGTVDSLVYTSSSVIVPNPTEYPASAYVTNQSNKSSVRDFTVDGTKAYMSLYYSDNCWAEWKLEFETKGHKYLNITYSATAKDNSCRTRMVVDDMSEKHISTVVDKNNLNVSNETVKINVSAYSKVLIEVYLYIGGGDTASFTITNCELTDD